MSGDETYQDFTLAAAVQDEVESSSLPGRLVVFEGADGVGKSAITTAVTAALADRGVAIELMTFPGREPGTLGRLVYDIHHAPERFDVHHMTPAAKQALHIAAHLDAIERRILPALRTGRHVILDRFWWSTWVYGIASGMQRSVLDAMIALERTRWGSVNPTVAVLLRRDAPIGRDDDLTRWRALQTEYDRLAERERVRYPVVVVGNSGPLGESVARVLEVLRLYGIVPRSKAATGDSGNTHGGSKTLANNRPGAVGIERRKKKRDPGADRRESGTSASLDSTTTHERLQTDFVLREQPIGHGASSGPHVYATLAPVNTTVVYDAFWRFAAERQRIFFLRLERAPRPWTDDPVLSTYKFTNAYRASDRVSQYLIRHVIYRNDLPCSETEVVFRVLLFKLFNRIETWELLEQTFGAITYADYQFEHLDRVLQRALALGQRIYSGAYIMPPGRSTFSHSPKHQNHLRLLERMMSDALPTRLANAVTMQRGFELLRAYPTIGDFLAYQFITDINYSEVTNFAETEFVAPGPGALDGLRKCFGKAGNLTDSDLIRFVADRQELEFKRLSVDFRSLWGRPLQLIDCQNLFCEIAKYARVRHPEIEGRFGRVRIKQKFVPGTSPVDYWYPPKWGINHLIPSWTATNGRT